MGDFFLCGRRRVPTGRSELALGFQAGLVGASASDTSLASLASLASLTSLASLGLASLGAGCRRAIRRARRRNVCSGNAFFM